MGECDLAESPDRAEPGLAVRSLGIIERVGHRLRCLAIMDRAFPD